MARWRPSKAGAVAIVALLVVIGVIPLIFGERWFGDDSTSDHTDAFADHDNPVLQRKAEAAELAESATASPSEEGTHASDTPSASEEAADSADVINDSQGPADEASANSEVSGEQIAAGGVSFSGVVQPILENRCVSCHLPGEMGNVLFDLSEANDAAEMVHEIAFVVAVNYMPPWPPSHLSPAFEHDLSLSEDEKASIASWAAQGGVLDVASDTPLVARTQLVLPIAEDQRIGPRDGDYAGYTNRDGTPLRSDDYRCQVHEVDDPEGDGTWLRGFEFRPDQTSVVHHAIVYRVPAAAADEIAERIARDDAEEASEGLRNEPGWTCFGLSGLRTGGVYSIQGWAPGQQPTIYPDGYGLYLAPGDMIVNQVHYHYVDSTPADGSWIILDTATEAEVAAGMTHIQGSSYLTPAEIPCTPAEAALAADQADTIDGYINLCERSNVLDEVADKYGIEARFIPDFLLAQCGGSVDEYDDLDGSVGYSSCDLPARNSGTILSVLGHMHEFGAAYRMTLHPDTEDELILLDIPVWDFNWQLNYQPVETISINKGDIVRFECWWDRTLQELPEPRYILWNEGTVDEMCFSSITVLPDRT